MSPTTFSMSSAIFRSLIRLIWRAATNTNSARLPASGPDNDDALRPSYGGTLPTSWTRTAVFASYQRRALRDSNRWNQRWRAGYNCCHRHFALHSLNTGKYRTVVCYEQSATGNFNTTITNEAKWHLPQKRS